MQRAGLAVTASLWYQSTRAAVMKYSVLLPMNSLVHEALAVQLWRCLLVGSGMASE